MWLLDLKRWRLFWKPRNGRFAVVPLVAGNRGNRNPKERLAASSFDLSTKPTTMIMIVRNLRGNHDSEIDAFATDVVEVVGLKHSLKNSRMGMGMVLM